MGQQRLRAVQHDIMRFMQAMGQEVRTSPQALPRPELDLRIALITEEYDETISALIDLRNPALSDGERNALIADVADGVVDMVYVLVGTTLAMGIDLEDIWAEVQRANMDKTTGPVRRDGKRLKPDDWRGPQVAAILREQRNRSFGELTAEHWVAGLRMMGERGRNCP